MTAVTISGTFGKNERPSNGLETIAEDLIKDQLAQHVVVGIVQFSGATLPGPGEQLVPRVKFIAIEPLDGNAADTVRSLLDVARKDRGLGRVEETLFDGTRGGFDFDRPDDGDEDELNGQTEIRLGQDGEHEVPPASGEEILAEREEAKAAERIAMPACEGCGSKFAGEPGQTRCVDCQPEDDPVAAAPDLVEQERAMPSIDPFSTGGGDPA
ncbi:hypothetical protein [Actinoplanes sp. N902-109]|uniref:hypothetical protein n=1 Tax=Actinoplanes sp. (strain N902-109) TaxID=649831 RepID=UPI0003294E7B|nr:hypothetical protein [Actinoplanes sp. N902-109]AGL19522.1 hypothetical protein L083_6012 [Actinoplanes sp. N902-109]